MSKSIAINHIIKISLIFVALFTGVPASANTYDARNINASDLLTGIYSITVEQTGITPVIRVKFDGNSYKTIQPGQKIAWKANTRGVCRSLRKIREYRWWLNDNTQGSANSYYSYHKKIASKDWITSKHSDDKYTANGELSTPVSAKMGNAAIKACNNYVQAETSKGKALETILANDKTLYSEDNDQPLLAGVVYMQCNADSGMNTMLGHAWQNVRINYVCEDFDFPKPGMNSTAGIGKIAAPFMLEEPKINVTPAQYSGNCPVDIQVDGTLKANKGQEDVQYRWAHNGAMGPVATVSLNTSGWKSVNTIIANIGANQPGNPGKQIAMPKPAKKDLQLKGQADNVHSGYVELKVLPAGEKNWAKAKTSDKGFYNITCKEPLVAGNAKLALPPGTQNPDPQQQADLTHGPSITIGNTTGQWGGMMSVDASAMPGRQREDRCELRVVYDVENIGQGNADNFVSKLFENNKNLLQSATPSLAAGQQKKNSGLLYLTNGTHIIGLSVDDQNQINESNESNNTTRITVEVSNCGDSEPSQRAGRRPQQR
jgi:hypothetical protein